MSCRLPRPSRHTPHLRRAAVLEEVPDMAVVPSGPARGQRRCCGPHPGVSVPDVGQRVQHQVRWWVGMWGGGGGLCGPHPGVSVPDVGHCVQHQVRCVGGLAGWGGFSVGLILVSVF